MDIMARPRFGRRSGGLQLVQNRFGHVRPVLLSVAVNESLTVEPKCTSTKPASAPRLTKVDRLVGLVVRRPPRERKIPGSNPASAGIFSGSSHTSDFKIGTPVALLPGTWRYRVSTGTGWPGVSIL